MFWSRVRTPLQRRHWPYLIYFVDTSSNRNPVLLSIRTSTIRLSVRTTSLLLWVSNSLDYWWVEVSSCVRSSPNSRFYRVCSLSCPVPSSILPPTPCRNWRRDPYRVTKPKPLEGVDPILGNSCHPLRSSSLTSPGVAITSEDPRRTEGKGKSLFREDQSSTRVDAPYPTVSDPQTKNLKRKIYSDTTQRHEMS